MTKIIWNIDSEYGSALFGSLAYDTVTDISETGFTLTKGSFETVFTGTFQLDDASTIPAERSPASRPTAAKRCSSMPRATKSTSTV